MRLSLASSLASSLLAIVANSQAGPAAAASVRLGRAPSAETRAIPEPQPSGGRPQPPPQSKAVALRARSLEDRPGPARGSLEDAEVIFGRELEELECSNGVGFVECEDGMEVVGGVKTETTCADACLTDAGQSQCCQGQETCDGFTGRVCRDGSCYGRASCFQATIGLVENSCKDATLTTGSSNPGACHHFMEFKTTSSVRLINSCNGEKPCMRIADNGSLNGNIIDSCNGWNACASMARDGTIDGDIRNSCNTANNAPNGHVCAYVVHASPGYIGGGIIDSCNGKYNACSYLADFGKILGAVSGSCSGKTACYRLAGEEGSQLSFVNNCCNNDYEFNGGGGECFSGRAWQDDEPVYTDDKVPSECVAPIPTPPPTSSPTPSNIWTLDLQDTATTLATDAEDDITFAYLIAAGRDYEISLREKGCAKDDEVDESLYTVTKSTAFFNSTHQWLNVSYSLIMTALASSPIWDNVTSTIELCQVTGLTTDSGDPTLGNLTVAQSITELEVIVNSVANFSITANLTGETIFNETEEVDAAAAIRAFKCDSEFEPNDEPLGPNAELFTCVGSADAAFNVESVDRMTITQTGKNPMKVIDEGNIQIPSITSTDFHEKGIIVRSRIPINLFDFEEGKILTIEGAVTMKLADGSSRRLNVELGSIDRDLQDESNEASYTVDVALEAAEESAVDLSNSAAGVAAAGLKGFAIAAFFLLV